MIRSILLGAVAGMRSMLPLAALSCVARSRTLSSGDERAGPRTHYPGKPGLLLLAVGELAGDKWPRAPDRISPAGLSARITTGALAAAAMAPRRQRYLAALLGSASAVTSGYLSFAVRAAAQRRFGLMTTGLAEDVIALAATVWILNRARADL